MEASHEENTIVSPGFLRNRGNNDVIGPVLGPVLPPGFKKSSPDHTPAVTGPALPPGFQITTSKQIIGPTLPPELSGSSVQCPAVGNDTDSSGDDDDDEVIGPMPPTRSEIPENSAADDVDARAKRMKDKIMKSNEVSVRQRESWMTELPPESSKSHALMMGLAPRKFRKDGGAETGGDRSDWTDTPADKERKQRDKAEGKRPASSRDKTPPIVSARDKYLAEQVEKHNKSVRAESLLEQHQKRLKKEEKKKRKSEKGNTKERKPFNREDDLDVKKFDDAQKRHIIKKSALLNTRFSHGGTGTNFL